MDARTKHFWRTLPPTSFLSVNRKEWEELHQRLNGGVPVPQERQLSYCVLVLHCAIVPRIFFWWVLRRKLFTWGGAPHAESAGSAPRHPKVPLVTHQRLSTASEEQQLPYFFEEIPAWC